MENDVTGIRIQSINVGVCDMNGFPFIVPVPPNKRIGAILEGGALPAMELRLIGDDGELILYSVALQ